ncbi:NAD(P)H-dependent oxidoreductase [Pandoraea fibrosis]|uniref:Flavodoxin family protein n=1 Tax=Pandoraea fibrosis TaxID=1891094 RepID=A0A5E4VHP4_9BURK|nr:NAD(P)H-dependent oxidoreductase [Pandoraea fibrosis]QHE91491.1 flavodoxin family protein [Pandoraea fibrosis]QHF14951.1 flavodoxin family protein [Pandoraea fibrosis]VVE10545.1 NAD(P)H dehydrogenase [Pandoraea fibrosis]
MHALVVVAHPDSQSLTHAIASHVAEGIIATPLQPHALGAHTVEIADLASEGFDPRFSAADLALFQKTQTAPADIAAEHARVDRADALVLVYPIYWWSFPALLKGWIDRVFTQGWAYEDGEDGKVKKKLQRMRVHLVAVGGTDQRTMARHGYFGAMKTQIDHGIFGYCGAQVVTSELLLASDTGYPEAHLDTARAIGQRVFASVP